MSLQSAILTGSKRLEQAVSGGPSVKSAPPADDIDAVRRVQKALVALGLGHMLHLSFPNGPAQEPDGKFGNETSQAVIAFQKREFPFNSLEWDGRVGRKTLEKMDALLPVAASPATISFICGPDVTQQVIEIWTEIQVEFHKRTFDQQLQMCDAILFPIQRSQGPLFFPKSIEDVKRLVLQFASVDDWDVLPLFQGTSAWLRNPPIFDTSVTGPCATPSSPNPTANTFDDVHEDEKTCSNTVQVAGKCWLNGTVNYGTFGIMVKLCSDAKIRNSVIAASLRKPLIGPIRDSAYSLTWAKALIRAYKRFGAHPEAANLPIAWTEATFNNSPKGVPSDPGNRPKCNCTCKCKGDVVNWDYVWEPVKKRNDAKAPHVIKTSCP